MMYRLSLVAIKSIPDYKTFRREVRMLLMLGDVKSAVQIIAHTSTWGFGYTNKLIVLQFLESGDLAQFIKNPPVLYSQQKMLGILCQFLVRYFV